MFRILVLAALVVAYAVPAFAVPFAQDLPVGVHYQKVTVAANGSVTAERMPLVVPGGPVDPNPPPPPPPDGISGVVEQWTKDAITAGGTPTTAAALSGVYGLVSKAVKDGAIKVSDPDPTKPPPVLAQISQLTDTIFLFQTDSAKWTSWRSKLSDALNTSVSRADLQTKEQWVTVLNEIKTGIDKATGFAYNPTELVSQEPAVVRATLDMRIAEGKAGRGILDIDIDKLFKILEFIMKLIEIFSKFTMPM